MQQRYYDSVIGRFLSVDPVTALTVPGVNFNRYWYGNNNPYKFTDPDGRLVRNPWEDPWRDESPTGPMKPARPWFDCRFCLAQGAGGNKGGGKVDLRDHEGVNGGHTISKHVGKSDQYLQNKISESFSFGLFEIYPREWSSFSSLESANRLVSSTIAKNYAEVSAWLSSPATALFGNTLVLNQSFASPTGRVAYREGRGSINSPEPVEFTEGRGVRVVLKLNPASPTGFSVLTAFPTK